MKGDAQKKQKKTKNRKKKANRDKTLTYSVIKTNIVSGDRVGLKYSTRSKSRIRVKGRSWHRQTQGSTDIP